MNGWNIQNILKQNIAVIEKWNEKWMPKLHPDKCTHMKIEKEII